MLLLDLNHDILFRILSFLDAYQLLTIFRVSSVIRQLALSKQLWIRLLRELESLGCSDLPPDDKLDQLSAEELIIELRRLVCGPTSWAQADESPAVVRRSFSYPFPSTERLNDRHVGLSAGGRFFFVSSRTQFSCFETMTGRTVWRYEGWVHGFAERVLESGRVIELLLLIPRGEITRVVLKRIDFATGENTDLLEAQMDRAAVDPYWFRAQIVGNLLVVPFLTEVEEEESRFDPAFIVIDRTREEYLWMRFTAHFIHQAVAFLPDHIAVISVDPDPSDDTVHAVFRVYPLSCLSDYWTPIDPTAVMNDTKAVVPDENTDSIFSQSFLLHDHPINYEFPGHIALAAHRNPLRHDAFVLTAYLANDYPNWRDDDFDESAYPQLPGWASFQTFHVELEPTITIRPGRTVDAPVALVDPCISFPRYGMHHHEDSAQDNSFQEAVYTVKDRVTTRLSIPLLDQSLIERSHRLGQPHVPLKAVLSAYGGVVIALSAENVYIESHM
ncbi:hypothetical protein GGX14DRAFT_461946 [Mycena pura]|uniref:F-box domain-containing protein n=1 Tax=Mycena pura TaxID=153505 RepID=A0AAD6V603_9AGAR|nr:hypothetical protein GGX14DRAFT_461946 [Mycena pura]